jgi:2-dehydropantoate 2-reductase
MIGFISWQTPLATETREVPGVAEYLPPGSPSQFGGAEAHARAAAKALTAGHCPARYNAHVARSSAQGSGALLAAIAGLEVEDWSFAKLRSSERLAEIAACARQSMHVAAAWHDQPAPVLRLLIRPVLLRAVLRLAPHLVPFDLETYLAYHFTKVGDQTRQHLETLIEVGQDREIPVDAIISLRALLPTDAKA